MANPAEDMKDETDPTRPVGIGERIQYAIKLRGIGSAAELARRMGQKEGLVRQHIHRNTIPQEYLLGYADALDAPVGWLLDGRGTLAEGPAPTIGPQTGRLRQALKLRAVDSVASLARATGLDEGRINQQLAKNALSTEDAPRIAEYLKISAAWLLTGEGPPPDLAAANLDEPRMAANAVLPPEQPVGIVGERDLPVYGAAQGGEGMTVDPHPIEWVKRPAPLVSVAKGFAVYVVGDSMSPAYEQGDMVFVHPGLPVGRGDDALLVSVPAAGGDWTAIVKRVTGWTERNWKLLQFSPRREFDAPRANFPQAYRIVGKYNRR